MTMREKIEELRRVRPIYDSVAEFAKKIIEDIYHYCSVYIIDITVVNNKIDISYKYGYYGHDYFSIPIEWFDEGFDYKAAYREMKKKEAEEVEKKLKAERKRKAAAKRRAAVKKANKEFETYLKLKKKYELNEAK